MSATDVDATKRTGAVTTSRATALALHIDIFQSEGRRFVSCRAFPSDVAQPNGCRFRGIVLLGGAQRLGELVKYADDLVILSATREQAQEARELAAAVLDGLGLRLHRWPSRRAIASITGKIRDRTDRGHASLPIDEVVERLNPVVRGWGNYFRWGNSAKQFASIDSYVNRRLAKLASIKHGRRGWNWTRYSHAWVDQLGTHRLTGTVRYWTASTSGERCR
jgi:hypothetical protein